MNFPLLVVLFQHVKYIAILGNSSTFNERILACNRDEFYLQEFDILVNLLWDGVYMLHDITVC